MGSIFHINVDSLKKEIENDPILVLDSLLLIAKSNTKIYDLTISVKKMANDIQDEEIRGILQNEQLSIKKAQVVNRTLMILNQIEAMQLSSNVPNKSGISERKYTKVNIANQFKSALKITISITLTGGICFAIYFSFDWFVLLLIMGGIAFFIYFISDDGLE